MGRQRGGRMNTCTKVLLATLALALVAQIGLTTYELGVLAGERRCIDRMEGIVE